MKALWRRPRALGIVSGIMLALAGLALQPLPAGALTGTHPVVVVLCNFTNQLAQPNPPSYYQHMFSDIGAGELGAFDYWRDVSYGNLSISGTVVKGWYTLGITRDQWGAYGRNDKWKSCAAAAAGDVNYNNFQDAIVVFPEAVTTIPSATDSSTTTIVVASTTVGDAANFPTPPFLMAVDDGSLPNNGNSETVNVTAISATTFTIQRAQGGTTAKSHAAGATAQVPGDLFGFGPRSEPLPGGPYTLGGVVGAHDIPLSVFGHEMGHGFGFNHSRRLSTSTTDYSDCYDLMSTLSCAYMFSGAGTGTVFGGSSFGGTNKGPGLNAVQLDFQGWLPGARETTFSNGSCTQTTYSMAALNHPEASGYQELRIPANTTIQTPPVPSTTTSDYYTVELRSKSGWDRGIPQDAFVLHLKGKDTYSYWVDQTPLAHGGQLLVADEYVDAGNNAYVAVNTINSGAFTGIVTLGACKINPAISYSGDTSGDFNDQVTLAADLTVSGSSAPVPNAAVTLTLGSQGCPATTDLNGHASCTITITQHPGSYTASAAYAGDSAYNSAAGTAPFTINKEESQLVYSGALTQDYHDQFTASATLTDPVGGAPIAGKPVTFTLGVGDTCGPVTTDGSGFASCSITPSQAAGTVGMVASFPGDVDYLSSADTKSFVITREETATTYTGPTVIANGVNTHFTAVLKEDGIVLINTRQVTITLGTGSSAQSCMGTTDPSGTATCDIVPSQPLGLGTVRADFLGDAFFLPSTASASTIIFAFLDRGAFVIGDGNASPGTQVTYFGSRWAKENQLSGGGAPNSFKGFASDTSEPPACGSGWISEPGASSGPPSSVPSYMGVVVAGSIDKSGHVISGDTVEIVVVKTDPGYDGRVGHGGTGKVVAVYCHM